MLWKIPASPVPSSLSQGRAEVYSGKTNLHQLFFRRLASINLDCRTLLQAFAWLGAFVKQRQSNEHCMEIVAPLLNSSVPLTFSCPAP